MITECYVTREGMTHAWGSEAPVAEAMMSLVLADLQRGIRDNVDLVIYSIAKVSSISE